MKFAHDFKETLASQGVSRSLSPWTAIASTKSVVADFPPHWVKQAIPYGQLKKCLKKVQRELQDLGLDPETLRALLNHKNTSPVALRYKLKGARCGVPEDCSAQIS